MEIHPVAILMILFFGGIGVLVFRQYKKNGAIGMFFGCKVQNKIGEVNAYVPGGKKKMELFLLEGDQIGFRAYKDYVRLDKEEALRLASILVDSHPPKSKKG